MHFAAWLVGGRLGARSARLLPEQRRRVAGAARRDGRRRRRAAGVFVDVRGLRRARDGADRRDAREAPDQRLRRDQAGGRARAGARRARARPALDRAALLQRRGRASRRHDRRGPRARDSPHSARHRGGDRRARRCRCSARTIRRPTAPACATTFTCAIWRTRTCCALRALAARRRLRRLQCGHRAAAFGEAGHRHGEPRGRLAGALDAGAAPAGRSGGAVRRERSPAARAGLAAHATRDLETIVRHAWQWHETRIRTGYRSRRCNRPDGPAPPPAALRGPAPHAHRRRDAGDAGVRRRARRRRRG